MANFLSQQVPGAQMNALAPRPPIAQRPQPQNDDPLPGELERLGFGRNALPNVARALSGNGPVRDDQLRQYNDLDDDVRRMFWDRVINDGMSIDDAMQPPGYDPRDMIPQEDSRMINGGGGARVAVGGGKNDQVIDPTATTNNRIQEGLLDSKRGLARMSRVEALIGENPDIIADTQSFGGNLRRKALETQDWLFPGSLSEEAAKDLTEMTRFRMNVIQNVNLGIKEMTGAQMSEMEAARIMAGMPNQEDSPTQFKAKLDESIYLAKMAAARETYWAQKGIPGNSWDQIDLQDMTEILKQRGADLFRQQVAAGLDPEGARAAAAQALAREFGL